LNLSASLDPPPEQPDPGFFQVTSDVRLRRFEHGEGRMALVVHGGPGFPANEPYAGLEKIDGFRFVYYDQRGCGGSTRPIDRLDAGGFLENLETLERTLGLGAQIADIERIRRILGEEKLVIVGHSFGAFIATLYAAEFPERVAAMVLVTPATLVKTPGDHPDLFESMRELLPEKRHPAFDEWLDRYLGGMADFERSDAEIAAVIREMGPFWHEAATARGAALPLDEAGADNNGGWMAYAMFFSMGMRHDYSPHLARVEAPVLVIHGAKDLQPEAATREYVGYFPNAELVTIEGVGHFPFVEAPESFVEKVQPFLERL
jgi:proline iminopeptidase